MTPDEAIGAPQRGEEAGIQNTEGKEVLHPLEQELMESGLFGLIFEEYTDGSRTYFLIEIDANGKEQTVAEFTFGNLSTDGTNKSPQVRLSEQYVTQNNIVSTKRSVLFDLGTKKSSDGSYTLNPIPKDKEIPYWVPDLKKLTDTGSGNSIIIYQTEDGELWLKFIPKGEEERWEVESEGLNKLKQRLIGAGVTYIRYNPKDFDLNICTPPEEDYQHWYYVTQTHTIEEGEEGEKANFRRDTVRFKFFPEKEKRPPEVSIIIRAIPKDGTTGDGSSYTETYNLSVHYSPDGYTLRGLDSGGGLPEALSKPLRVVDNETGLVVKIVEAEDGRLTLSLEDNKDQPEE